MATRKGGSFGWFLIGILVGAIAVAGLYFYVTRDGADAPAPPAEPALPLPPTAGAPPIAGSSSDAPSAAPPATAATPSAAVPRDLTDNDRQIADDAAATGMTGPVNPAPDQPTN